MDIKKQVKKTVAKVKNTVTKAKKTAPKILQKKPTKSSCCGCCSKPKAKTTKKSK